MFRWISIPYSSSSQSIELYYVEYFLFHQLIVKLFRGFLSTLSLISLKSTGL